jgi:hypothetical protein
VNNRIPEPLRPLLERLLSRFDAELPGFVTGFYLHGSIALDAFNPRRSDIDFLAVISRIPTPDDIAALSRIHREVHGEWPLQGAYLQPADLGQPADKIAPAPNYHDGKLEPAGQGMTNDVTWWLLKNGGVALRGPEPAALDFSVDTDRMLAEMRDNLNTYWARWPSRPRNMLWILFDSGVEWAVLGPLRQLWSFRERAITDKSAAGRCALERLPERWHRIIREAIRCRDGGGPSLYRSRLIRALDAAQLVRYVVITAGSASTTAS